MNKTTTQLLAELEQLAGKAGDLLYKRIGLCDQILNDDHWLNTTFDGRLFLAEKTLSKKYFPDLSAGGIQLGQLLHLYRTYSKDVWKKHAYSINDMQALFEVEGSQPEKRKRENWKERALDAEDQIEHLKRQIVLQEKEIKQLNDELAASKARVHDLETEAATLGGRLMELERRIAV